MNIGYRGLQNVKITFISIHSATMDSDNYLIEVEIKCQKSLPCYFNGEASGCLKIGTLNESSSMKKIRMFIDCQSTQIGLLKNAQTIGAETSFSLNTVLTSKK